MSPSTHVIVGAGPLGSSVARSLLAEGHRVRLVSRLGRATVDGATPHVADATVPASLDAAFSEAAVVYQCAQPAYHRWAEEFPALQDSILDAATRAGADVVIADNLYTYGSPGTGTITESSPESGTTRKGAVRRKMAESALARHRAGQLRVALSRPSTYFGPGYELLNDTVFRRALKGQPMQALGSVDHPHSFSYVPDAGKAMATLGTSDEGWGRVWIPPVQPAVTTHEFLSRIWRMACQSGRPRIQVVSPPMLRLVGFFSGPAREAHEMMYEFTSAYVVDSGLFQSTFEASPTPMDAAITATLQDVGLQR